MRRHPTLSSSLFIGLMALVCAPPDCAGQIPLAIIGGLSTDPARAVRASAAARQDVTTIEQRSVANHQDKLNFPLAPKSTATLQGGVVAAHGAVVPSAKVPAP